MKLKRYTLLVLATITLFGLVGWSGYAQKTTSGRAVWEYKEARGIDELQLNALGAEGWEMIGFTVVEGQIKDMYFKRAK